MSSVDVVEFSEGSFSPDDESSDVSSGGELEKVKSGNMDGFDSRDVSKGSQEWDIGPTVDNKRSSSGSESSVSVFSVSSSDLDSVGNLLDIGKGANVLEEFHSLFSSLDSFDGVINNKREFRDLINSVASGLNQGEDS